MAVEDDSLMSLGNLFHSFGPAREKDLEPTDRESTDKRDTGWYTCDIYILAGNLILESIIVLCLATLFEQL